MRGAAFRSFGSRIGTRSRRAPTRSRATGVDGARLPVPASIGTPREPGLPPQAMLIGIILAPIVESNFFIGLRQGHGSPEIFFTRPISLGIWSFLIVTTVYFSYKKKQQSAQPAPR